MHTEMWEHPATVDNVATLRRRGAIVLEPAIGRLTGADTGKGRLPEPAEIAAAGRAAAAPPRRAALRPGRPPRRGQRRRHPRAARSGAVPGQLLLGQAGLRAGRGRPPPAAPGSRWSRPTSTCPIRPAPTSSASARPSSCATPSRKAADDADVVVMAAAVADFRPGPTAEHKIKKDADAHRRRSTLAENPDVLAELVADRAPGPARRRLRRRDRRRTADVLEHGRAKLARKGCDLLVVNAGRRRHRRSASPTTRR